MDADEIVKLMDEMPNKSKWKVTFADGGIAVVGRNTSILRDNQFDVEIGAITSWFSGVVANNGYLGFTIVRQGVTAPAWEVDANQIQSFEQVVEREKEKTSGYNLDKQV